MPITGTGTGPFTVTGTETIFNVFVYVINQNGSNGANLPNGGYRFNCVINVGDGSTSTLLTSENEYVLMLGSTFTIRQNATLRIGRANPARLGSFWVIDGGAQDSFQNFGTLQCYGSRIIIPWRALARADSTGLFEECSLQFADSYQGAESPGTNITYRRCFLSGSGLVAMKLGGNIQIISTKISGAQLAFQPLPTTGGSSEYNITDYIADGNDFDFVPNAAGFELNTNVNGAFDANGVPLNALTLASAFGVGNGQNIRLRWRYDLSAVSGGSALSGATVRIRNTQNTTVFSGSTNAGGAIPQQLLTRIEYAVNSGTITPATRWPYAVRVRRYDRTSNDLTFNADNHTAQVSPHVNVSNLALSQAAAAALTGISLVASGANGGTATISANRTASDLWCFFRNWISTLANFDSNDTWSFDGLTLNIGAWNLVVQSGATFTGSFNTTGSVTNNGSIVGTYTSAEGASAQLRIAGLTSSAVALFNGSGVQVDYVPSVTGEYVRNIAPGAVGVWTWTVKRAGFTHATGSFSPGLGGATVVSPSLPQKLLPDGSPMYLGTSSSLCAVSFSGTTTAFIDIGNGTAPRQAVFDESEDALITAPGLRWLASGRGDLSQFDSAAGDFLFLTANWRLRRSSPSDQNATVQAFVQSTQGVPVDEANGPVRFLTSDSPTAIAQAVLLAMNSSPPNCNVERINGADVIGDGSESDPWRGVGVSP